MSIGPSRHSRSSAVSTTGSVGKGLSPPPAPSITVGLALALAILCFCPPVARALPGDLDGSGRVDGYDLVIFGRANGSHAGEANWNPEADLNGNGAVDPPDLAALSALFGQRGIAFGLWIGDRATGTERVAKLSSRGNLIKRVGAFSVPAAIDSNVSDGSVWVADSSLNKVKKLDPATGATLLTINGMHPRSLSVNSRDGSVWVADASGEVVKLLPTVTNGYTIGTDTGHHIAVTGFNDPESVAVNPETGFVWVAEYNRVTQLFPDVSNGYSIASDSGKHATVTGFSSPSKVAVNTVDGSCWVADTYNDSVVKLLSNGTEEFRLGGFDNPADLDVNWVDGSVWVVDTVNDRVVRLSAGGAILATVGGFDAPGAVAANPLDGSCWAADSAGNQLVKVAPSGSVLARVGGFSAPDVVALTPDSVSSSRFPAAYASLGSSNLDVGQVTSFTGTGTDPDGTIVRYEWDFDGNGVFDYQSSSTGLTTHAYGATGVYTPVFRVTDNDGLQATDYSQVVRVGRLAALPAVDVNSGSAPLTVNFTGGFVDPIDGYIDSYQWDFDGDGSYDWYSESTGSVTHTYLLAGTYKASLKVTDGPHVATAGLTVTVATSPPTATASANPAFGVSPLSVAFTGTGTDADGQILLYEWDFNNDGTYDWFSTTSGNATHTYGSLGDKTARFRVTDNDGQTDLVDVAVSVVQTPPVAVANASPQRGFPPLLVNFTAAGSHDPNGSIVLYEWNFSGECVNLEIFDDDLESGAAGWEPGAPWGLVTSDAHTPTHSWTDSPAGNYAGGANTALTSGMINLATASAATLSFWHRYSTENYYDTCHLEISTDGGASWATVATYMGQQVTWKQEQVSLAPYLPSPSVKLRFRLTSDGSNNYDGWYVDDVSVTACDLSWTASPGGAASHTYPTAGAYTATLRVTDNGGGKATDSVTITVQPTTEPLVTVAASPASGTAPLAVTFTGTGTVSGGSIAQYQWNFGEEYVWVADNSSDKITRLWQDGSGEAFSRTGMDGPCSVSVNPVNGSCWVADLYHGEVVKLGANGTEMARVGGFYYPSSVSVNPTDGTCWVADSNHNQVVKLAPDGTELVRADGFDYPSSVSVNPTDGTCWVADSSHNQVVKLAPDGTELVRVGGFSYPNAVSVNPTDGSCWVADPHHNQVVKLKADGSGELARVGGFSYPNSVSVNSADGTCWVSDYYHNQVVKLKADGSGELARVGGFYDPMSVSVNPTTGIVWVADTGNDQVVKLAADGTETRRLSGFNNPRAVSVADSGAGNYAVSGSTGDAAHTYSAPGIYKPGLTVTDNHGTQASDSLQIVVHGIPVVTAVATPAGGPAPLESYLSGTVSDPDGTVVTYEWDFDGDGSYDWKSAATPSVRHVFATAGTSSARLRVIDNDGYVAVSTVVVAVTPSPPTATAVAAPFEGNAPLAVDFAGAGSDPDGTVALYEWDFTADGAADYSSASTASTSHTYATAGTYTAVLSVTDDSALKGTDPVTISVSPAGTPSALMTVDKTQGFAPLSVSFCGFGSDPDGSITAYEWDFDGDGTFETSSATPPTAFGDTMEDGTALWTADAPWGLTHADRRSPSFCWTDSPGGSYANSANLSLATKTITLAGTIAPKLTFWHRYGFGSGDSGRVEVSGNNGSTWSQIASFSGTSATWVRQAYSLASYQGNTTVKVRFRLVSDSSGTGDGWYVDDVWIGDCPTRTYQAQGLFQPTLRVTDSAANQATASEHVTVFAPQNTSYVWVADTYHGQVAKLADDGRTAARISGFSSPRAARVDPATGEVWVADTGNNRVVKLAPGVQNGYDLAKTNIADATVNMNGGYLVGETALVTTVPGFDTGLTFDGNGDYVQIADSTSFRTTSWTMEARVKPNTVPTGTSVRTIFGKVSQSKDFAIGLRGDKPTVWTYAPTQTYRNFQDGPSALAAGTWYHVAGVYDAPAGVLRLYVDGVLVKEGAAKSDTSNTDPLLIGKSNCCSEAFDGVIDDVRLWNVARTGPEIAGAKDAELTGTEVGLVGYWKLNEIRSDHQITTGFYSPATIDVDPADHGAWVADRYNNRVVKLTAAGAVSQTVTGFSYPQRLAVDTNDGSVWVSDDYHGQVVKLSPAGTELHRVGGYYNPAGVAVDQSDSSVWVADYSHDQLVRLTAAAGELKRIGGFNKPISVAVNPGDRSAWVTDYSAGQVAKLSPNGTEIARVGGFSNPSDLAVNPKDGTVWVSDSGHNQMVKLATDGTELLRIDGFSGANGVSIDPGFRNLSSPPTATASAAPTGGTAPLTVTFTGTGTGSIARYEWDCDGDETFEYSSASTGNTTHTYREPGTYNPVFRVTDSAGTMDADGHVTIVVGPQTAFALADPATGNAPLNVDLSGGIRGLAGSVSVAKYEWDFEGDGIFDWSSAFSAAVTHRYTRGDTYGAVLKITDSAGTVAYADVTVVVNKVPPVAYNYATPASGPAPLTVTLDGSASDADGTLALYEWDYDGDGISDWSSTSVPDSYFSYPDVGIYDATFRVTDNDGLTDEAIRTITVSARLDPPVPQATASLTEGRAPLTVTLGGTAADPDDGQILLYEWDFEGDGTYDWSSPSTATVPHSYPTPGEYNATLRVKDLDNLTAIDTVLITVKAGGAPNAVANAAPTTGDVPLVVSFDADGSSDAGGSIVGYQWTFGDDEVVWVAELGGNKVDRLIGYTKQNTLSGYAYPTRIALDRRDGSAWVTEQSGDRVVKARADGTGELGRLSGFDYPWGIAVNQADGTAWVTDHYHHQVVKLKADASGELLRLGNPSSTAIFYNPTGVAIDETAGIVWVADYNNDRVIRLSATDGTEQGKIFGFNGPHWLAVSTLDGGAVWVADQHNNQVVKLAADVPPGYNISQSNPQSTPNAAAPGRPGFLWGNTAAATGNLGGGLSFDGSGDYVQIGDHAGYRMTSWTLEAWIKPATLPSGTTVRTIFGKVSNNKDFAIGLRGSKPTAWTYGPTQRNHLDGPAIVAGTWHHVAGVYDAAAGKLQLYVDGALAGELSAPSDTSNNDNFRIGTSGNGSEAFNGVIDDVRIWSTARTATEIADSRNAEIAGSETGLVGYWKLNEVAAASYHRSLTGFQDPRHLSVNPADGTCWVAEYSGDRATKVDRDNSRRILQVGGFNTPYETAVNPVDGTVWVADYYNSRIVKLSAEGRVIAALGGYSSPTSVAAFPTNVFRSSTAGATSHTYTQYGAYQATLIVTDNDGLTDFDTVDIKAGLFPTAIPTVYPNSGTAPLTVRFSANGTSPDATIVDYAWDYNGDGSWDWTSTVSQNTSHTYALPGTYTAYHRVTDDKGLTDTKPVVITVTAASPHPTAVASALPVEGTAPLFVTFTGRGIDTDGFVRSFSWDFDGDGTWDFTSAATGQATHTYPVTGIFNAKLRVADDDGNFGTDQVRIEVKPVGAPTATATAAPTSGTATFAVSFGGSAVDDGTITLWEWDYEGDGTWDYSSPTTAASTHSYSAAGTYDATLRVTDNAGLTDTAVATITVTAGLTASISGDSFDPTVGQTVLINSVITTNAVVTILVKDRVGTLVRTLVDHAPRAGGYYSDAWNGKDNGGQLVAPGVYFYVVEYTIAGVTSTWDQTNTVSPNSYAPTVTYPPSFDPFSSETNFFRYTLDTKSEVTIYMSHWNWQGYSMAGPRVKTLLTREPQKAGSYVMVWDGTDDQGNLAEPGEYLISVWGWLLPPNAIIVHTEPVIADLLVQPTYFCPAALPYDEADHATFTYTLSKKADVTAYIYDSENYLVRTITMAGVAAGEGQALAWNGRNDGGFLVAPGIYRVKLIAVDARGSQSLSANALVIVFY